MWARRSFSTFPFWEVLVAGSQKTLIYNLWNRLFVRESSHKAGRAPGAAPSQSHVHKWATCERVAQVKGFSDSYLINSPPFPARLNSTFFPHLVFTASSPFLTGVKLTVKPPDCRPPYESHYWSVPKPVLLSKRRKMKL